MRKKWNKKPVILTAAALALTAAVSVGSALAYFTTYTTAEGSVTMNMGFTETIPEEEVDSAGKHVWIRNNGEYDCFVRVKVFAEVNVSYEPAEGWSDGGDGYWYYGSVLPAGGRTSELLITYQFPEDEEPFDIIVVQECTPVLYDENGMAYPDWDYVITTTDSTEQEGE